MFTGIVEEVGLIQATQAAPGGRRLTFSASFGAELRIDQSVSVNGVCLTVEKAGPGTFSAFAIQETLRKSSLGQFRTGSRANLERAMRPDGRLDGHIVQGHVDTTGEVVAVTQEGESRLISVAFNPEFDALVIPRGSVAIDGVSLTVARLESGTLTVAMIPHTLKNTNADDWKNGVTVNIEFDLLGKYVIRAMEAHGLAGGTGKVTRSWLEEQGFG